MGHALLITENGDHEGRPLATTVKRVMLGSEADLDGQTCLGEESRPIRGKSQGRMCSQLADASEGGASPRTRTLRRRLIRHPPGRAWPPCLASIPLPRRPKNHDWCEQTEIDAIRMSESIKPSLVSAQRALSLRVHALIHPRGKCGYHSKKPEFSS
eukprot:scaffold155846_cov33-Tisochrysis_lutea.AAC.6